MLRVAAMAVDIRPGGDIRVVEEGSPVQVEADSPAVAADNPEPEEDNPVAGEGNSLAVEEGMQARGVDNNLPAERHRQQACRIWGNRWPPGSKGSHS